MVRFAQGGWTPPIPDSGLTYVASMAEAGGTLWVAGTEQDPWSATQQGDAVPVVVARWDGTSWTRYGPESGLDLVASNLGVDISLSAAGGRVWAAGREGLFRLDGDRWTNVLPATAPAFAERMVVTGPDEAWVVDRGVLWRVEGGRWSLAPRVGLLSNAVVDLAQGPDGALWAATASGLARLDGGRWRDVADVGSLTGRATGFAGFASVAVAPDGAVWALEDDGRVVRIGDGVSVPQPAVALGGDLQVAADGTVWAAGYSWAGGGGVSRRGADGRWTPESPWGKGPVTESCNTDLAVAQGEVWAVRRCWAGVLGEEEGAELAQFDGAALDRPPRRGRPRVRVDRGDGGDAAGLADRRGGARACWPMTRPAGPACCPTRTRRSRWRPTAPCGSPTRRGSPATCPDRPRAEGRATAGAGLRPRCPGR